jgi:hypothetical protein
MSSTAKTALWFFGLPVFFFLVLPYIVPHTASNINKNVFPAFREIEQNCQDELFSGALTVRCQSALRLLSSCDDCSASHYHARLSAFGFTLPPLSAD